MGARLSIVARARHSVSSAGRLETGNSTGERASSPQVTVLGDGPAMCQTVARVTAMLGLELPRKDGLDYFLDYDGDL